MKQEDKLSFVDAMEKEITDQKEGVHFSIVHHDTLPNRAQPNKAICCFKNTQTRWLATEA